MAFVIIADEAEYGAYGRYLSASRKGQAGQMPVEQPWKILRDQKLLNRAARSADSHGPLRHAIAFDEMLLDHHQRLAREIVIAVLLHYVLRGGDKGEAARESGVEEGARGGVAALVVIGAAATAETVDDPAVPKPRR